MMESERENLWGVCTYVSLLFRNKRFVLDEMTHLVKMKSNEVLVMSKVKKHDLKKLL